MKKLAQYASVPVALIAAGLAAGYVMNNDPVDTNNAQNTQQSDLIHDCSNLGEPGLPRCDADTQKQTVSSMPMARITDEGLDCEGTQIAAAKSSFRSASGFSLEAKTILAREAPKASGLCERRVNDGTGYPVKLIAMTRG